MDLDFGVSYLNLNLNLLIHIAFVCESGRRHG